MYPEAQLHEYELPLRLHFPPFWHGFGRHGFFATTSNTL
jgi:hypothetical protein